MPENISYIQDDALSSRSEATWLRRTWLLQGLFLLLLAGVLYHSIFAKLVANWWNDPDFSHGFVIPIFSLFVVWQQRKKLAELPLGPSWPGPIVVGLGLIGLIAGLVGGEVFLSRSSLVFLLAG